jgi:hypothetical protein
MPKLRLVVLTLVVAACTPSAATSSLSPVPSSAPSGITSTEVPSASSVPPSVAATPVPSLSNAPGPSVACIDRGQLADTADSATTALQGLVAALKANNLFDARTLAGIAATQMRSLADLVAAVRPDAAAGLRSAADKLDTAKAAFPGSAQSIAGIQTLWDQALQLARAGACPD